MASSCPIVVNTNSFCEEDLTTFLECSERIQRCEQRQRREWLKKAVLTSEKVFETSVTTDDDLMKRNEGDQSYMSQSASMEDLLKYFEEDVNVDSDTQQDVKKLEPNCDIVEELTIRPSQVKQNGFLPANGAEMKSDKSHVPHSNKTTRNTLASDKTFTNIEPMFFKKRDEDGCIKPSDLKALRWQSSAPSGSYSKPQNGKLDPFRKFVKLSDLDLIDSKTENSNGTQKRFSSSNDLSPSEPTYNNLKRNHSNDSKSSSDVQTSNFIIKEEQSKPNEYQARDANDFNSKDLKKILDSKPSHVSHQKYLKPSDLNLTRKEWEARYFQIIQNDLKPKDLNLTQQQWDERYFQIIRNDLKPVDAASPSKPNKSQLPIKLEEWMDFEDKPSKWEKELKPKKSIKSRVQKMAEMFNGMITQVMKNDPSMKSYERFTNEASPEPAKPPQPRARTKFPVQRNNASPRSSPRPTPRASPKLAKRPIKQTGCLIPEEVFNKLSVKDKAVLFNKFMREMSKMNPDFSINYEEFTINGRNQAEPAEGKVLTEKQETVKNLARELEAKIIFPKQTISPGALIKPIKISSKKGPAPQPPVTENINEQQEDPNYVSTLTVVLKPSPNKADSAAKQKQTAPTVPRRKITPPTVVVCPSMKRPNNQLCSSIPIEVYAPPRKIRRTRPERSNSKKFFQNPNLEQLFYEWMKERHGLSFSIQSKKDINPVTNNEQEDNDKTIETDTTIKNDEPDVPKKEDLKVPTKAVFKNDPSESDDSSLMTMPSSKINTDESQTDQAKESPADFEFLKPVRPPRKKKVKRATLTWKKDASIVEKLPLSTTDSDSDFKNLGNQIQQKLKKPANVAITDPTKAKKLVFKNSPSPSAQSSFEVDDAFLDFMNSPRKIRNAYTLTVMTSPSQKTESILSNKSEAPAKPPRKGKISPQVPHEIDESKFENEDQGFETGSNGYSPIRITKKPSTTFSVSPVLEKSPLFIKLNAELERRMSDANQTPTAYSTPVKNNLNSSNGKNTPVKKSSWHTVFSPIQSSSGRRRSLADSESRRSSIVMDVIREEQQLLSKKADDDVFLPSTPLTDICSDKKSVFWISMDDLKLSMEIFENPSDRLSLLSDIFNQKSGESRMVHFGIDDLKYSSKEGSVKEDISKSLPKVEGVSYYWFASGDLAVPFQGNFIAPDRVEEIFAFIRDSSADDGQLSFGVDDYEFSKIPEPASPAPKFSIESSYSMLIGLNGQGNEHRSKFTWPTTSRNSTPQKTSDFDPSEFDSDSFEVSEMGRLSFSPYGSNYFDMVSMQSGERTSAASFGSVGSPEMFSFEYENEPLDKMFGKKTSTTPTSDTYLVGKTEKSMKMPPPMPSTDSMTIDKMIETIRRQQHKLKNLESDMKTYTSPAGLTSSVLDKYHGRPYVKKLHNIVKSIQIIGKTGFENCTAQQLESFLYFLTLYAETCLSSCSNQMNVILEQLRKDKPAVV